MLKDYVEKAVREYIGDHYPHVKTPGCMLARVTRSELYGDAYRYRLQALAPDGSDDAKVPEMVNVASETMYQAGDTVEIVLLYGMYDPVIIGRHRK